MSTLEHLKQEKKLAATKQKTSKQSNAFVFVLFFRRRQRRRRRRQRRKAKKKNTALLTALDSSVFDLFYTTYRGEALARRRRGEKGKEKWRQEREQ